MLIIISFVHAQITVLSLMKQAVTVNCVTDSDVFIEHLAF